MRTTSLFLRSQSLLFLPFTRNLMPAVVMKTTCNVFQFLTNREISERKMLPPPKSPSTGMK